MTRQLDRITHISTTPNDSCTASAAAHRHKPKPSTTLTYHSQPGDLHTNRGVHQTRVAYRTRFGKARDEGGI
jgi:hypothetical protein